MSARPNIGLAGEWVQIIAEMPILPDVPEIAGWVREQRVTIGKENTTFEGDIYDFDRCPVLSRLLVAFFEDPDARELFLEKPTQTMFTATVTFCVGHHMVWHGGNTIFVLHDRDSAREKVKDDVAPLLRKIPALGRAEEEAEVESTVGALRFTTGVVRIGSGGTKATLTSIPAAVVVLDECELHPLIDGAHSINRARERLTGAAGGGKLIAGSKPEKEAILERDDRTRKWRVHNQDGAHLDSAFLSGSQLRYECQCPHCRTFAEPIWEHIKWDHCRDNSLDLPEGLKPPLDLRRVEEETHWQCPHCRKAVQEGPEKHAWVLSGRWVPTPTAERRGRELFAEPFPHRWSAQMSALTDIAFKNLRWGTLALKFIEAQSDPAALRAFRNGILGKPEALRRSEDTTLEQMRRLIAKPLKPDEAAPAFYVPPYQMRNDGELSGDIPLLSTQLAFVGMAIDTQDKVVKWTVRAHAKDGTMPLLDLGLWNWSEEMPELMNYLDATEFRTRDGKRCGVHLAYIDPKGHHWHDIMALTCRHAKLQAAAGEGRLNVTARQAGPVWRSETFKKVGTGVIQYWTHAANHWESRLYEECIQKFNRKQYRYWAPAMWLPTDIPTDFMEEHTNMHKVIEKGKEVWRKINPSLPNDYGDCSKIHLVMDWNERLKHLMRKMAEGKLRAAAASGSGSSQKPKKPRVRIS